MSHTPYVSFEAGEYKGHHITRVGCMKCNTTIASKNPDGTLYFWDHKRDVELIMSNGSLAFAPVCKDCFNTVTNDDMEHLENTIKHGWLLEQAWAFRKGKRPVESVARAGKFARNIFVIAKRGN